MRTKTRFAAVVVLVAAEWCRAQAPATTGSLSGRVVEVGTGQPVRKATVTISGAKDVSRQTTADEEGAFRFTELPPGRYRLFGDKPGYINTFAGVGSNSRGPGPVDVVAGKEFQGAELQLARQGVIMGRVVDLDGEPIERASVQAIPLSRRNQNVFISAQTDDRGEYRLSKLPPGAYTVMATRLRTGLVANASEKEVDAPTFHPAALDPGSAAEVRVRSGEERSGVDIRIQKTAAVRISGRLTGLPAGGRASVTLQPVAPPHFSITAMAHNLFRYGNMSAASVDADMNFTLRNVRPGEYHLLVTGGAGSTQYQAVQRVRAGREDVEGLTVALLPMVNLRGAARSADPGAKLPLENLTVLLAPAEQGLPGSASAKVTSDGSFVLPNAGRQRLMVHAYAPAGWYLKSVSMAGQRLPGLEVDLSAGAEGPLELVYSNKPGAVEGVVDKPAFVYLVPQMEGLPMPEMAGLLKGAQNDSLNKFRLDNVRPGAYRLYAVEPGLQSALLESGVLEALRDKSVSVTVEEGATATATPTVLTEKDIDPK